MAGRVEGICLDMLKFSNVISTDYIVNTNFSKQEQEQESNFEKIKKRSSLSTEDNIRVIKIENQLIGLKTNFFYNYYMDSIILTADGLVACKLEDTNNEYDFLAKMEKNRINKDWLTSVMNAGTLWTAPFNYNDSFGVNSEKYVSLSRTIKTSYSRKISGILMVNANISNFLNVLKNLNNGTVLLVGEDGKLIVSSGENVDIKDDFPLEGISRNLNNNGFRIWTYKYQKYFINYHKITNFDWTIISILPYEYVSKEINLLKTRILTINILVFGVLIISIIVFLLAITKPLKKLVNELKRKKIGVYSLNDKTKNYSEDINGIVKSFEYMFSRIDKLVEKIIIEQEIEQKLKYESLKAQINPHFLFNTLSTIKWTAMISGARNVSNMITDLGMLLEVSMNKGGDEITIFRELELVTAYVNIQNARYNGKISIDIKMDTELNEKKIIKLLLQPIVENAIIHGFKNYTDTKTIYINGKLDNGVIELKVKNYGEIIPQSNIKEILTYGEELKNNFRFNGIGLKNINERLKIKYGEMYGLSIHSTQLEGTIISIIYPDILTNDNVIC